MSKELGINYNVLCKRIQKGHTFEEAISLPVRNRGLSITYNGKTQNLLQWSKELKMHRNTIMRRLDKGYTFEEAVTIPAGQCKKKK